MLFRSTLRGDGGANKNLYGRDLSARDIVEGGKVGMPAGAGVLISALQGAAPRDTSAKPVATTRKKK